MIHGSNFCSTLAQLTIHHIVDYQLGRRRDIPRIGTRGILYDGRHRILFRIGFCLFLFFRRELVIDLIEVVVDDAEQRPAEDTPHLLVCFGRIDLDEQIATAKQQIHVQLHRLQIFVLQVGHVHQVQRIRLQRCQCLSLSTEWEVSTVDHQNSIVVFRSRGTRLDLRCHLGQDPPKGTEEVIAVLL